MSSLMTLARTDCCSKAAEVIVIVDGDETEDEDGDEETTEVTGDIRRLPALLS